MMLSSARDLDRGWPLTGMAADRFACAYRPWCPGAAGLDGRGERCAKHGATFDFRWGRL